MSGPAAAADDELVELLARSAVERAAPEELPLFRATSAAYFKDPAALEERRSSGDDMLGFGPGAAVMLVTPVALAVSREVLQFLGEQVRKYARTEGEGAVKRLLDRLVKGKEKQAPASGGGATAEPPELTDEQLKEVRRVALEKARQLRLSEAKAELLADSLVGTLATT